MEAAIPENTVKIGQEFTAQIKLRDVKGIYAEDFVISYSQNLLGFRGFEEIPGYKVYYAEDHSNGTLRFIVASQGAQYGINTDTVLLKLRFAPKGIGAAAVTITKGRIADTAAEYDLEPFHLHGDTVAIQNYDVNRSGEYTLVDLAIDDAHLGELGSSLDPVKYAANQVGDDWIRDEDLVFIATQLLVNWNYAPCHN